MLPVSGSQDLEGGMVPRMCRKCHSSRTLASSRRVCRIARRITSMLTGMSAFRPATDFGASRLVGTAGRNSERLRSTPNVSPAGRPHRFVAYRPRSRRHLCNKAALGGDAACGRRNGRPNFARYGALSGAASPRGRRPSCARRCAMSARGSATTSRCGGRPSCAALGARTGRGHGRPSCGGCGATNGPAYAPRNIAPFASSDRRATTTSRCHWRLRTWHTARPGIGP
jgi:hypothetical protein